MPVMPKKVAPNSGVEPGHFLLPAPRDLVLRRRVEGRGLLGEQGHRVVFQIDHFDVEIAALARDLRDPLRGMIREPVQPDAADDDGKLGFADAHGSAPSAAGKMDAEEGV